MLLAVLLTGLIAALSWNNELLQASAAEPGYLDFDNLPETNFSCESKVIGGYYADVETGCQMFHVCTIGQKGEVADIKFLCLNGTVFDQETRVCERLDEVDCSKSESYYDLNLELYGNSGATYGIQPENEEEPPASNDNDEDKCDEDEEDCKTEPQEVLPNKPAELEDEYDELEELPDPTTSSTTSTTTTTTPRPTRPPSTTSPRPAQVPYPTSSPETIAALLALHNAFQESLKEHERPPPPRVSNSFPSPSPVPVKSPPPPPRFSSPVSFSTSPRPLSFAQNQNFPSGNQPSLPQQPQVSNHHFPAPQSHKQPLPQPFPFNVTPKPKQPAPAFSSTLRTSQAFGNSNFQQSFREEQQQKFQPQPPQEEDEEYSVEDYDLTQPSSPPPLYNAYKHNQNRFAISHQDTNPNAAPSNFLLHQLKLRFNENPPQKHPGAHGFTRAVSNHDTKILSYPEKPIAAPLVASSTTPAAVSVILSKTSTTSVVRSVSSRNQSAISHNHSPAYNSTKYSPSSTQKPSTTTIKPITNISQPLEEDYKTEEEYDYYQDELGPDPFYKDVPKLERQRRSLQNDIQVTEINRLRMKYLNLLKYITKNKRQDPEKLNVLREKLNLLKDKIRAFREVKSDTKGETTAGEENIDSTFPTITPPEYKHIQKFEFTLLANNSFVRPPFNNTDNNTEVVTIPLVPNTNLTSLPSAQISWDSLENRNKYYYTKRKTSLSDLVTIPEDITLTRVLPKRKQIHEDYFGSISSSRTEDIKELLERMRSKSQKRKAEDDPTFWFRTNDTNILVGGNFSESICTGNRFYDEFIHTNITDVNFTSSPTLELLLGIRNIKICSIYTERIALVFLIERMYFLDTVKYRIKQETQQLLPGDLSGMIEIKNRIKVLQYERRDKTFKVVKEISTNSNPRFVIENILRM